MGSILDYRNARHNLKAFATGERQVVVKQMECGTDVGIFIGRNNREYSSDSFGATYSDNTVPRKAFARVIDKLEPAIQSLFQRYLAEVLNEMQQVAFLTAKAQVAREEEESLKLLADMERPFDAPEPTPFDKQT